MSIRETTDNKKQTVQGIWMGIYHFKTLEDSVWMSVQGGLSRGGVKYECLLNIHNILSV